MTEHLKQVYPSKITDVVLNITDIQKLLPHRYPFLLVDKVRDIVPFESATGLKMVTSNEWFFEGHFPGHPIMPGVLIIEAMAQTAGVLILYSTQLQQNHSKIHEMNHKVYFLSVEEAKFRKPVLPGDALELKVTKERARGNVWRFKGRAYVDNVLCDEVTFTAMVAENAM